MKSEIARREVKFLVIKGIIRNVHLAIFTEEFAIGTDNCGCVVIDAGTAFLEKRRDDDDPELTREFAKGRRRSSGHFLGQLEILVILGLAKVLRPKKFGEANDLPALLRRVTNEFDGADEILLRLRAAPHLNQGDLCSVRFYHSVINHTGHEGHEDED